MQRAVRRQNEDDKREYKEKAKQEKRDIARTKRLLVVVVVGLGDVMNMETRRVLCW